MKNTIFEQAALEASAGLKEINAEAEHLEARKEDLLASRELLEAVGRQLFTVISMMSVGTSDETVETVHAVDAAHAVHVVHIVDASDTVDVSAVSHEAIPVHDEQELEPVAFGHAEPEAMAEHVPTDETVVAADATADAPAPEPPTFAELLSQSKPYSLRNDGWPAATPVTVRTLRSLL